MSLEYLISIQASPFIEQPVNQPINQSINQTSTDVTAELSDQSTNQPIDQPTNQPLSINPPTTSIDVDQSINEPFNQPINQPLKPVLTIQDYINESINQSMAGLIDVQNQLQLHFDRTRQSSIIIQSLWRGYVDRSFIQSINQSAIQIQRVWRGHITRRNLLINQSINQSTHQYNYANLCATRIQAVFRGFICRTRQSNFYQRKKYLQSINQSGNQVKQQMIEYAINQSITQSMNQTLNQISEFQSLTENLHHLLSTKSTPGIYQSRLGPAFNQSINQSNVEDHLIDAFQKRQKRLKSLKKEIKINQTVSQLKQSINEMNLIDDELSDSQWIPATAGLQSINQSVYDPMEQLHHSIDPSINHSLHTITQVLEEQKEALSHRSRPSSNTSNSGSRFPPIHRQTSFDQPSNQLTNPPIKPTVNASLEQFSPKIKVPPSGRSIILDRHGKPVTVERPKVRKVR